MALIDTPFYYLDKLVNVLLVDGLAPGILLFFSWRFVKCFGQPDMFTPQGVSQRSEEVDCLLVFLFCVNQHHPYTFFS